MFTKDDEKFTETAADPARRLSAITDLTCRRTILLWCASVLSLILIASLFGNKPANGALLCSTMMQWIFVFKFESDLRLLRVIDRLQK
jgi:hypothetical protein